jgi:hypothetical protein
MLYRISINNGKIEAAGQFVREDVVEQVPTRPGARSGGLERGSARHARCLSRSAFLRRRADCRGRQSADPVSASGAFSCASIDRSSGAGFRAWSLTDWWMVESKTLASLWEQRSATIVTIAASEETTQDQFCARSAPGTRELPPLTPLAVTFPVPTGLIHCSWAFTKTTDCEKPT